MMGVDGLQAARNLSTYAPLSRHGWCLYYVWTAYKAAGAVATGSYPTALASWEAARKKHPGDRNPPAGVPVYWGVRGDGNRDGDIVISLGGGQVVCTDYPGWGQVGTCTIDERERQIGREYLGWSEDILGAVIDYDQGTGAGGGGSSEEEWLMNAADDVTWIKERLGGSLAKGSTLSKEVDELSGEVQVLKDRVRWLMDQVGGSAERGTSLRQDVDKLLAQ